MSGRLLGEAAVLGPVFGLPARTPPPPGAIEDPFFTEQTRKVTGNRVEYTYKISAPAGSKGYWKFTAEGGETLRIGPLMLQIRPGPARYGEAGPSTPRLAARLSAGSPDPARRHVRLDLDQPLPLGIRIEVSAADRRHLGGTSEISGKAKWSRLEIPSGSSGGDCHRMGALRC